MARPLQDELLIISCLRQNSRQALKELSRQTKIPISTIYEKIKRNNDNLVRKYTAVVDFNKLGFGTRAHIAFKVDAKSKDELAEHLGKSLHINSLYRINNGYDFMVEAVFRHLKELEDFLEHINEHYRIKETKVFHIIDELKKEEFMAIPDHVPMLYPQAEA